MQNSYRKKKFALSAFDRVAPLDYLHHQVKCLKGRGKLQEFIAQGLTTS